MKFTGNALPSLPAGTNDAIFWDDDLPGFGLRCRAGGSKTWVVQYKLGPQQRRESLGDVRKVQLENARKIARNGAGIFPIRIKRRIRQSRGLEPSTRVASAAPSA